MSNIHQSLLCPIMLHLVMLCPAAWCCGGVLTAGLACALTQVGVLAVLDAGHL